MLVLNFILSGIKKVLKSIKFDMVQPASTLYLTTGGAGELRLEASRWVAHLFVGQTLAWRNSIYGSRGVA